MAEAQAYVIAHGWQAAGFLGALVYIGNFLMIATDRLTSHQPLYYRLQLCAAALVLASLAQQFNPAAAVIQSFVILVSLLGLYRHRRLRRGPAQACTVEARKPCSRSDFGAPKSVSGSPSSSINP
jgi:hypothetical protein